MKAEQKKMFLIGGVVIVLLIIGVFIFTRNQKKSDSSKQALPTEAVIPTVDSSVKVSLENAGNGKEVILKIDDVPSNTDSIDYELSYNTAQQGLQGVIGTITEEGGGKSYEKKLTLGTCSSGTCVYHQVVGKIKLSLKFNGSYGEKVFENEYSL